MVHHCAPSPWQINPFQIKHHGRKSYNCLLLTAADLVRTLRNSTTYALERLSDQRFHVAFKRFKPALNYWLIIFRGTTACYVDRVKLRMNYR